MLPFLRNANWLSLWLLSALTELAVVLPWTILLYSLAGYPGWQGALPGIWLFGLIYTAAWLWETGSPARHHEGRRYDRIVALAVGMAVAYGLAYLALPVAMRPGLRSPNLAMWIMPAAGYLWYQGARNAAEGLLHSWIFLRFKGQAYALGLGVVILTATGIARDTAVMVPLYWSIFLLSASGLMLLVVLREKSLREGQKGLGEDGGGSRGLSRLVNLSVLGLTVLTGLASYLISVERLLWVTGTVIRPFQMVLSFLADVVMLVLYRYVVLLIGPLFAFLNWLMNRPKDHKPWTPPPVEMGEEPLPLEDPSELANLITNYGRTLAIVAVAVALAVYLYRLKPRRRAEADPEEERVDLGFWDNLLADLRGLIRRRPPADGPEAVRPEQLDPRDPRALFRRLQDWGWRLGRPRLPAETPTRYQQALAGVRADATPETAVITAVYNQARYGAQPPVGELVDRAVAAADALDRQSQQQ